MLAIITGASSGIGYELSIQLSKKGYDLILVSRNQKELEKLQAKCKTKTQVFIKDLSKEEDVLSLYEECKNYEVDLLINNAGFGRIGDFSTIPMDQIQSMSYVNDIAPALLMRLFLPDMIQRKKGIIVNVASSAAYTYGPMMAMYYATKSYLFNLSVSVSYEMEHDKTNVSILTVAPGPIETNFQKNALEKPHKGMKVEQCVKSIIRGIEKKKRIIIPGVKSKLGCFFTRFLSTKTLLKIGYRYQSKKK